jgi:hypothetical protein
MHYTALADQSHIFPDATAHLKIWQRSDMIFGNGSNK